MTMIKQLQRDSAKLRSRLGVWGVRRTAAIIFRTLLRDFGDWVWDVHHGVNTRERIPVSELGVEGLANHQNAEEYVGSDSRFLSILTRLRVSWNSYMFVDLGCGKGKALLLAAQLPFSRIIGVELSSKLAQIAARNVASYCLDDLQCRHISVVCEDAAAYAFPPESLVVYCYNPFLQPVMTSVLRNLQQSLKEQPRELYLIYVNPILESVVADAGFLALIDSGSSYRIYRAKA